MGNYVLAFNPSRKSHDISIDHGERCERIGTNGAGSVFLGLLVAAYVLDRRPEFMRAARWLNTIRGARGAPRVSDFAGKRETLTSVRALVAFNYYEDDSNGDLLTAVTLDGKRVLRGIKLKRPADPLLDDLGVMFERYYETVKTVPLEPERVRRIAGFAPVALGHLKESCWHDSMVRLLGVFTYAVEQGWPVLVG